MNKIDIVRKETEEWLENAPAGIATNESSISPSGNYSAFITTYEWTEKEAGMDKGFSISKVEIWETDANEILFSFLVNESTFFHSWVNKNDNEYLLCAEDLCGGQTVIDLTNKKMASYTENENGFIWTNHILSPDETMLAVFGCYWATPYFCIIYDFTDPMDLPLKVIKETPLIGYDFLGWVDNKHLKIMNAHDAEPVVIGI